MRILLTGSAGFIGSALAARLADDGHEVLGVDSLREHSVRIGLARLRRDGFDTSSDAFGNIAERSCRYGSLRFLKCDISDAGRLLDIVLDFRPEKVVHLAACPGVRDSYDDPAASFSTNVTGFFNILQVCRQGGVRHLLYASSSSVYGENISTPFRESDNCTSPCSVYAATKLCDEALASSFCRSYGLRATGVRMFSVYGPWGRPDMAPMIFVRALTRGIPVELFGGGLQTRDFTYIGDVVESLLRLLMLPGSPGEAEIYNIGSGCPVPVVEFLRLLEEKLGVRGLHVNSESKPYETQRTFSDSGKLFGAIGYRPSTPLDKGIEAFVEWYVSESECHGDRSLASASPDNFI